MIRQCRKSGAAKAMPYLCNRTLGDIPFIPAHSEVSLHEETKRGRSAFTRKRRQGGAARQGGSARSAMVQVTYVWRSPGGTERPRRSGQSLTASCHTSSHYRSELPGTFVGRIKACSQQPYIGDDAGWPGFSAAYWRTSTWQFFWPLASCAYLQMLES